MTGGRFGVVVAAASTIVGTGLVTVLEGAGLDVRGVTADLADVGRLIAEHRPDVVLVADAGGEAGRVVADAGGTPVLVVGTGDAEQVVAAIRSRANGFVSVDDPVDVVVDAVRAVAGGRSAYPTGWQDSVIDIVTRGRRAYADGRELTAREHDIVELIVDGCSNKEIARALGLAHQTIKNQLGHIMLKLGLSSRLQLYRWAVENGITPPARSHTGGDGHRP